MTTLSLRDLGFLGGLNGYDTDAQTYITAVEAADGQSLEAATKQAINDFVVGCKVDNIWSAIKASCILAGARTLAGALVPLVGTAPTNNNFVSGDYNRKTGLVGDGTTKYLFSNRNNNADGQDSKHIMVYATTPDTRTSTRGYIGASYTGAGWSAIIEGGTSLSNQIYVNGSQGVYRIGNTAGFIGCNRGSASIVQGRNGGITTSFARTSETPSSGPIFVYATNPSGERTSARIAFYSIGQSLDLTLFDNRVTALITAIGVAF